jgi:hypothetical protein
MEHTEGQRDTNTDTCPNPHAVTLIRLKNRTCSCNFGYLYTDLLIIRSKIPTNRFKTPFLVTLFTFKYLHLHLLAARIAGPLLGPSPLSLSTHTTLHTHYKLTYHLTQSPAEFTPSARSHVAAASW